MTHGGLPARRPDQHDAPTPRGAVPGARTTPVINKAGTTLTVQIVNNPVTPVEVQIVNNPTTPVVTQDGGIPGALTVQGYCNDGAFNVLVAAGVNVRGLKLWSASISSVVMTNASPGGSLVTDDVLADGAGNIYLSLENGIDVAAPGQGYSSVGVSQELHGITVPAGRSLRLNNGATGVTHRTSVTVVYTIL